MSSIAIPARIMSRRGGRWRHLGLPVGTGVTLSGPCVKSCLTCRDRFPEAALVVDILLSCAGGSEGKAVDPGGRDAEIPRSFADGEGPASSFGPACFPNRFLTEL